MKANRFSFGRVVSLALTAFVLSGLVACVQPQDAAPLPENVFPLSSEDSIIGSWKNLAAVGYTESYSFSAEKCYSEGSWEIESPYVYKINETSGYVYGKYTKAYEVCYENPNDSSWIHSEYWMNAEYDTQYQDPQDPSYTHYESWWRYSSTAPDVGKWYAVYYYDLATADGVTTVKISGAAGDKTSVDTLDEAVVEFTEDNRYFNYDSTCTKQ